MAVKGPDAEDFLQRMVSNDVNEAPCEALLLTPKARLIAPLVVWRRAADDFLLLTEPGLGEVVRAHLKRMRLRAQVEVEAEEHTSHVVFGAGDGVPTDEYGVPAVEVLDTELAPTVGDDELELLRIRACTPRWGRELDERVLPAEAGLEERAISFTKGCYPGQEPIARLHYRGHPNRGLRVLEIEGSEPPAYDAEVLHDDKVVGRVTSALPEDGHVVALAYVRREVPDNVVVVVDGRSARVSGVGS